MIQRFWCQHSSFFRDWQNKLCAHTRTTESWPYWKSYGFYWNNMALTETVKPVKTRIVRTSLCWCYWNDSPLYHFSSKSLLRESDGYNTCIYWSRPGWRPSFTPRCVHPRPRSARWALRRPAATGALRPLARLAAAPLRQAPSAAQAEAIPLFSLASMLLLVHAGLCCAAQLLAPWPVCRASSGPVQKPCKSLFVVTPVPREPRFTWGWGGDEASTSALCTAGLAGCTSARPQKHQIQSNCRGVCN